MKTTEVVAALIWRGDKFLICRRPEHKVRALLWEFAGGKVERGESREEALIRECREELDLCVEPERVFAEVTHPYPDLTVHLTLFSCKAEGEPRLLEHAEMRWIAASEIPMYEFCPADKQILEQLQADFH